MRRHFWLGALVVVTACTSTKNNTADMMAPPDMASGCRPEASGLNAQYVIDLLKMPNSSTMYAFDFLGDGILRNKLGDVVQTLKGQNIDLQMGSAAAIMNGEAVILVQENAAKDLDTDTCVNAKVMKDPRLQAMMKKGKSMPFDMKRMSYGGFKTIVEA